MRKRSQGKSFLFLFLLLFLFDFIPHLTYPNNTFNTPLRLCPWLWVWAVSSKTEPHRLKLCLFCDCQLFLRYSCTPRTFIPPRFISNLELEAFTVGDLGWAVPLQKDYYNNCVVYEQSFQNAHVLPKRV